MPCWQFGHNTSKSDSGSYIDFNFGTGCSTVRTPARFEYRSIFSCPGWPQWGLEPPCGLSLRANFRPRRRFRQTTFLFVRRHFCAATCFRNSLGARASAIEYGQDWICYHLCCRCGVCSGSSLERWALHTKHRSGTSWCAACDRLVTPASVAVLLTDAFSACADGCTTAGSRDDTANSD